MCLVSVCIITYNQEKYVQEAIESILCQVTNFAYELIISDDCSTDQTDSIIRECIKNNSSGHKITYFDQKKNIGIQHNFAFALSKCNAPYTAICEGDDYWIDSYKLQKQVDFMELNPFVSLCYTNTIERFEETKLEVENIDKNPVCIGLEYLLEHGWFIRTATIMFRNKMLPDLPNWFFTAYATDYILQVLLAGNGKLCRINDLTAVYRHHDKGVSNADVFVQLKRWEMKIKLLKDIDKYYEFKYSKYIKKQFPNLYLNIIENTLRSDALLVDKIKSIKYIFKVDFNTYFLRLSRIIKNRNW